jgi:hypothetical protein
MDRKELSVTLRKLKGDENIHERTFEGTLRDAFRQQNEDNRYASSLYYKNIVDYLVNYYRPKEHD